MAAAAPAIRFEWRRGDTLALAAPGCTHCQGLGLRFPRGRAKACGCVLRAIFRACYARWRHLEEQDKYLSRLSLELISHRRSGLGRSVCWGRKSEEFCADFFLVAKRSLKDRLEWDVFRLHFLLAAEWSVCCRVLGIDRGTFFHRLYRVEERLGRVFRELKPYSLFPIDEYFASAQRLPLGPKVI